MQSLQEKYAPTSECFGCGPANQKGLRIRSIAASDDPRAEVVCQWRAEPHHLAFPGVLNGGICGALLDCHSNWTAAHFLMRAAELDAPPTTVTAEFAVKLKRPTPLDATLTIRARVVDPPAGAALDHAPDRATVEAEIEAAGKVTATCRGVFVAVKEGHPAFHRW